MNGSMSLTRRGILTGMLTTTALTALPTRVRAEPMTVLAAGAAVVGIITGIAGVLSDAKKDAVLKEISGKLDAVIRNQAIILAEIQGLKLYVDEALHRSFRENTIVRMNAHQDRYEVLIVERPSSANRAEYVDLETSVSQTAFELGQYDTPAYIAFGAGVGMTLAIHQALRLSAERFAKLKQVFKRPYDRWLDPANQKSIVVIVGTTKAEVDRRTAALNARPKAVNLTEEKGRCTYTTRVSISGDLTSGFSGSSAMTTECEPPEDICIRRKCPISIGDEVAATEADVSNRLLAMLSISTVATIGEVTVPQFVPSGFAVVDDMNRERIAIFELMTLLARQQVVQNQMESCRNALAA